MTKRFLKKYFIYIGAILSIGDSRCLWYEDQTRGSVAEQRIFDAIHTKNIDEVRNIIDEHPNAVNARNKSGRTALTQAIWFNNFDIVQLLLRNGADVNARMLGNTTALHVAAEVGHNIDIVKLLVQHGAHLTADEYGTTPLHLAARVSRNLDVICFLIECHPGASAKERGGMTPLHYACTWRAAPDVVKVLLDQGAPVNDSGRDGNTPLHLTANRHYPFFASELVIGSNKAQEYAIQSNNAQEIVKLLLTHNALVNSRNINGQTPLHLATKTAPVEVMSILLRHGALVNGRDKQGKTPLHLAGIRDHCQHDNADAVELLIRYGADINARDNNGHTPLHNAILYSDTILPLLLAHGAHVYLPDNDGRTSLFHAVSRGWTASARLLIEHGADVDIRDNSGQHLLHEAVINLMTIGGFKILFQGKRTPDIEVLNPNGESALFVALQKGYHEEFSTLIERYATLTRSELRHGKDCWIATVTELLQQRKAILLSILEHTKLPRDLHMVVYGFVTEV